ncbi:MAG: TonB-dependent receptor [Bacteroidales bacterium]|jgi:hypothetical protein|nr:TonB-dependent receptor [Bacteroidales bacterium]NPV37453.1 TonB-dependent receptor [Bacteroidales bacterium]
MKRLSLTHIILFVAIQMSLAEELPKRTVSGIISDASSGEVLIGATVLVKQTLNGTSSNVYGFYSITLPAGVYELEFSFVGYDKKVLKADLSQSNLRLDVALNPKPKELATVVISAEKTDANVKTNEMSVIRLDSKTIERIPALLGEVDIIRAMQMLPGVKMVAEGSTGFSVRGGAPDQNLILLDEAQVYNAAHLLGFFSVFNNDVVKDVKIYKGDIPATDGGRLSSLLDIRTRDGNNKSFHGNGGIGLISSRLSLEGPLSPGRSSFIVAGRRTYADVFLPLSSDKAVRDNTLYFYDFNGKISHTINEKNRLFLSGYLGRDVFKNPFGGLDFGNQTLTLRWNHLFSDQLFANFTGIYTNYDYFVGTPEEQTNAFKWTSGMKDYGVKADFTWFLNPENMIRFGGQSVYHYFNPGIVEGIGSQTSFNRLAMPVQRGLESAIYISNDQQLTPLISLKYGLRFSLFHNIGPATVYEYNSAGQAIDSVKFGKAKFYHTRRSLEPRIAGTYILDEQSSFKISYSRTVQYIQLAQNSTAGTPLDIWFMTGPNIEPQHSDIIAAGYFRNFSQNTYEASVEIYYKHTSKAIDFKDQAQLLFNEYLEAELRTGQAKAYGIELLLRRRAGRFNGWIAYTLSKCQRTIAAINNGKPYSPAYDKPHEISVVSNFELNQRMILSANWVYSSGTPVTFPTGRAVIGNNIVPVYSDRNAYRMPAYHRLDLSFILKAQKKENRKWDYEWNFSLYNAYGRKNAWTINFRQDPDNPQQTIAEKTYLFGVLPSITFNFNF